MVKRRKSLGHAFSDEVVKVASKGRGKNPKDEDWRDLLLPNFDATSAIEFEQSTWRTAIFLVFTIIVFFVLFLRLFHLQIVTGKSSRELADGNRIQVKVIHAPRGIIYDRSGKILAANSPAFRLIDPSLHKFRLITRDEALDWEVNNDPRAQNLEVDNVRTYPFGEKMAHAIGYVGEITEDELKEPKFQKYKAGEIVGQSGIEAEYENYLRGRDGGEIIEVDSKGRKVRTLRVDQPIPGQSVYLNLDADLTVKLFTQLADAVTKAGSCCGAAVAEDPQTGGILALVSYPSFDPNVFSKVEDEDEITKIFTRADSPSLNRVIGGTYPPGSTFKIVTSLATLGSGKVSPDTVFQDNGVMYLGTFRFTNWYFNEYGRTEGPVNLLKAIQRSNDTYFYQVSQIIGEQAITDMARKLKMGGKLNIDIPGEVNGLIPDNSWKLKTFDQPWYPGDTLHMAIGQGFVLATPLQILGITSYIAAGGQMYKPQMVQKVMSDNILVKEFKKETLVGSILPKDKINLVADGLKEVPKQGGTAWPFFTFPLQTAGKTGTAEFGDPKNRTHGWYTSYAPADDPKIALTVLVEAGGEGSNVAAPVAKEIYRWYFSPDKNKLIQDNYNLATDSGKTLGE